jgi:hypothetical protein
MLQLLTSAMHMHSTGHAYAHEHEPLQNTPAVTVPQQEEASYLFSFYAD